MSPASPSLHISYILTKHAGRRENHKKTSILSSMHIPSRKTGSLPVAGRAGKDTNTTTATLPLALAGQALPQAHLLLDTRASILNRPQRFAGREAGREGGATSACLTSGDHLLAGGAGGGHAPLHLLLLPCLLPRGLPVTNRANNAWVAPWRRRSWTLKTTRRGNTKGMDVVPAFVLAWHRLNTTRKNFKAAHAVPHRTGWLPPAIKRQE